MPGQLFNFSRYFKKKDEPTQPVARDDTGVTNDVTTTAKTTTTSTTTSYASGAPYSGIGYPSPGTAPYSGIGTPPAPTPNITSSQTKTTTTAGSQIPQGGQPSQVAQPSGAPIQTPPGPPQSQTAPPGAINMQKRVGMDILTRLTQRSNQTLMTSVQKAKQLHLQYVDTEHVLWGLLTDSAVFQIISELKVTPSELQQALEKNFKPGNFAGPPQFSPRVKRVLELALTVARSLGYEFISPEHILLALAQEGEGLAAQTMTKFGLTVEVMQKKITGKKETKAEEKEERGKASTLEQFTDDLTQKAREDKLDPVVARAAEIERVIHILSRRTKNNPVLIGDAGVGKTAIVEGLAQRIASGDVPETLLQKKILQLDLMSLIAGAKHRGEFEERLKNLIKEVKSSSGQIILFIDEIHNMVGAGSGSEGTMDASNILKPSLARGELQTIGTTTITEYRKHIESDPALERRFQPVLVAEPSADAAIEMLRALRDKYEAYHKVSIPDETIEAAVRLSQRYVGDRFLPDKAVDLIDEAAAAVRLPAISLPEEIKSIQEKLKRLEIEKKDAEKISDSVRLVTITREIEELNHELEEKKHAYEIKKSTTTNVVSPETIQEIVSRWTNIPISKLSESESEKLLSLEDIIHKRIINQEEAVAAVAEAVRRGRAGLKSNKRPIGSFIFMGPTGVGKTELAKALAEILFGSDEMMVRLDMTEYMEKHEVAKLIGAPPGYVGYEEGGQLTEAVRRHPYSVVLLDEIEKANPDVFNVLIQILDDGRLTDNKGHVISFKNTIVICTSNIGTGLVQKEMVEQGKLTFTTSVVDTYVVSPTGRQILTLGKRMWEYLPSQKSNKELPSTLSSQKVQGDKKAEGITSPQTGSGWITKLLSDYFAGNTVVNADKEDINQQLPKDGVDVHVISPSGEEIMTKGDRFWTRKSTTAKEWITDNLIALFKDHTVINALPDQPEQQLPTAKLSTNAISPKEAQVLAVASRFWRRENLVSKNWITGTLAYYLKDGVVVEAVKNEPPLPKEEKDQKKEIKENQKPASPQAANQVSQPPVAQAQDKDHPQSDKSPNIEEDLLTAAKIIRDPELQLPTKAWDVHLFTPRGEEIIIVGDRFWRRAVSSYQWTTDKLEKLFSTLTVTNADPDDQTQILPVGQVLEKAKQEQKEKQEEQFIQLAQKLTEELRQFFRPELLNRFDEIIVFRPLTFEHVLSIVDLQFKILAKLLEEQNIGLSTTEEAKKAISILGYDPVYGARPLRRVIQREVENHISSMLIKGDVKSGDTVIIDFDGNEFNFSVRKLEVKKKEEKENKQTAKEDKQKDATSAEISAPQPQSFKCQICGHHWETKEDTAKLVCPKCQSDKIENITPIPPSPEKQTDSQQPQEKTVSGKTEPSGTTPDQKQPEATTIKPQIESLPASPPIQPDIQPQPPVISPPVSPLEGYFGQVPPPAPVTDEGTTKPSSSQTTSTSFNS